MIQNQATLSCSCSDIKPPLDPLLRGWVMILGNCEHDAMDCAQRGVTERCVLVVCWRTSVLDGVFETVGVRFERVPDGRCLFSPRDQVHRVVGVYARDHVWSSQRMYSSRTSSDCSLMLWMNVAGFSS